MNKNRIHIAKRENISNLHAWGIRLGAIVVAIIICALVTVLVTGDNPFSVFKTAVYGAFGTSRKVWDTMRATAILLLIALALTPAFKMRFWNIGGEGQVLMGGLATVICMKYLGGIIPDIPLILLMSVAAIIAGMIWAVIPAIFKAIWNTNETLFTLMMNYIATQIVAFCVLTWGGPNSSGKLGIVNQDTRAGWIMDLFGNKYLLIILVALVYAVLMLVYLKRTKHGYELTVVGESVNTARYVGIKVEKVFIRTMCLSGAICGIVGLLIVGNMDHTISTTTVGGQGFTAVLVSWMAQFNPLVMIFSSLLIIFMGKGASSIALNFSLNESFSDILTGIILFCLIGCEFFINYRICISRAQKKEKEPAVKDEKGGAQ